MYVHASLPLDNDEWSQYTTTYSSNYITVDTALLYTYSSYGYLYDIMDAKTFNSIHINWSGSSVNGIYEKTGNNKGQEISISYNGSYTDVRASGSDDIYNTDDDVVTRYIR